MEKTSSASWHSHVTVDLIFPLCLVFSDTDDEEGKALASEDDRESVSFAVLNNIVHCLIDSRVVSSLQSARGIHIIPNSCRCSRLEIKFAATLYLCSLYRYWHFKDILSNQSDSKRTRRKDLGDISYTSQVIDNSVKNFVRGRIRVTSFNSRSARPRKPPTGTRISKVSSILAEL